MAVSKPHTLGLPFGDAPQSSNNTADSYNLSPSLHTSIRGVAWFTLNENIDVVNMDNTCDNILRFQDSLRYLFLSIHPKVCGEVAHCEQHKGSSGHYNYPNMCHIIIINNHEIEMWSYRCNLGHICTTFQEQFNHVKVATLTGKVDRSFSILL